MNPGADRGVALVDALLAVAVLGVAAAATTALLSGTGRRARSAALENGRAEVAMRVADQLRAGRLAGDSGSVRLSSGLLIFDASFVRSDAPVPGGLSISIAPVDGGSTLILGSVVIEP